MGLIDIDLKNIGGAISGIREAITGDKIKDPTELAKIDLQLEALANAAKTGQIEINKIEAANKSLFVAGWRPAIGWVAAVSLALMYIPKALVMTTVWTTQCYEILSGADDIAKVILPQFPEIGTADVIGLVMSMLGMAGLRTYEKKTGVSREK